MSENPVFAIEHRQPLVIVISGVSAAGKDSVVRALKERGRPIHFVITANTRAPRPGEVDGKDYHFVSEERFLEMVQNDELLEHARVYNGYRGVPRFEVRNALASGQDVILRVDVQGALTIKEKCPEAVMIFLTLESEAEMIRRMEKREKVNPDDLATRRAAVIRELQQREHFDYEVVNAAGKLDAAVDLIEAIIETEHHRVHPRQVTL